MAEAELPGHLAAVEPPAPGQYPMSGARLAAISTFWMGTNILWAPLLSLLIPSEVAHMAGHRQAAAVGLTIGAGAIIPLILPLIVGPMSDRCRSRFGRRRPYIFAGVGINLVGLAGMYYFAVQGSSSGSWLQLPTTFWGFFMAFLVVQLGNNIATAPYQGIIPDVVVPAQRGLASGYMATMTQAGSALGFVFVGLVFKFAPFQSYLFMAVSLLVCAIWTAATLKETPLGRLEAEYRSTSAETAQSVNNPEPPGFQWEKESWLGVLKGLWIDPRKYPDFAWVWITRFLVMFGFYTIQPFVTYYLRDVIHIPRDDIPGAAGKIFLLILVAAAFTGIAGGRISDRIGRKKIVYIASVVMAIGAVVFTFCTNITQVLVVGLFFGLGYGAYVSVDWALGTDVLPNKKEAGKDMAVWHIAMVFPQSLAAPVAGVLLSIKGQTEEVLSSGETITHYHRTGYVAAFVVAAVGLVLGAVLINKVRSVR